MRDTLSWKHTTDINTTRTLFSKEVLPYTIESYICSCSHQEIIIRSNYQDSEEYICKVCENENFLDSNYFFGNTAWYDPIEDIFSYEILQNFDISLSKTKNHFLATVVLDIPNSIELSCDEIGFLSKEIFQISIDELGEIKEELFANFNLDRFKGEDLYCFDDAISQDTFINKHPLLVNYKTKILENIVKNRYFKFSDDINKKIRTMEHIGYFVKYSHLREFDFYYWKNVDLLPQNENLTVNDALNYVINNRKEKSLKKAVFAHYKEEMIENRYYFLYPFCVSKYIQDVNIATRLLKLNFYIYFKGLINHNSLEYFLQYLTKCYSDKQIENLFKSFLKQEIFWFADTIELFAELSDDMRDAFPKIQCKYNILHDEIVYYHRLTMDEKLLDTKYIYTTKQYKANVSIESYNVKLPKTGKELYDWATMLQNCMAGYSSLIEQYKTVIYGFFKNDKIVFAVEIQNGKIVQALAKYNVKLNKNQMDIVLSWYEEFILEKKEKEQT